MPRRPNASGFSLSIDDDFDEVDNHRVRLFEIEEKPSQFADAKGAQTIVWKMNIYRADGTAFLDTRTGGAFDLWAFTTDSTFKTSKARQYLEAFLGKEMSDEEVDQLIDDGFAEGLVGKTALGSFEVYTTADGNERLKLVLLRADRGDRGGRRAAATPAPEPEPAPVAAAPAPARQRRIDD